MKRFWEANYGGQPYDPVARRKGAPTDTPATIAPVPSASAPSAARGLGPGSVRSGGKTPVGGHRSPSAQPELVSALQAQIKDLSGHLEGLEKERDFYFAKVRVPPPLSPPGGFASGTVS
jgi:microtubule-associated protein, RP/EB family